MTSEWAYAGTVEAEGAVLYGIDHDSHVFCHKVGLIRSYAQMANASEAVFSPFSLGTEGMTVGQDIDIRIGNQNSPDRHARMSHKAYKNFRINDLIGSRQRFMGQQIFGFTETSSTPRHETIGVAAAGRFYPTIKFEIPPVANQDDFAIEQLRFDYWIEPDVGAGGRRTPNLIIPAAELVLQALDRFQAEDVSEQTPQQAGLFRDRDHALTTRLWQVGGIGKPGAQVFVGAEKPLRYEIVGPGIIGGGRQGWDNLHGWGASSRGLPSTPGMPYGVHLHWRWAAAATNPAAMVFGDWTPDFLRVGTLAGRNTRGEAVPGGPLIDPRTPQTDLRIAVVKLDTANEFKGRLPDTIRDFESLFSDIKRRPEDIRNGDRLVYIVSITQRRPDRNRIWRSLVFPHGLFFPHSYDIGYINEAAISLAGAYEAQYLPREPRRTWIRIPPVT